MNSIIFMLVATLAWAQAKQFRFINRSPGVIWVGSLGNSGQPAPNGGGWAMNPGQQVVLNTADNWAGRFWPRTYCDPGSRHCQTGDCGNRLECNGAGGAPPATLVEITLQGYGGKDYYDISLVDGFNTMASIKPIGGSGDGSQYSCRPATCSYDINKDCPSELRLGNVGCKSACLAFNTDQYCCRNAHGRPETCRSSDWPNNYPKFFKDRCPDAYSYAYDDHKSTFTCNAPIYEITFG